MYPPVLVVPPVILPVTVEELKAELPATAGGDALIEAQIKGAVSYLDGWTGILGRCLVEQTWRQDFDRFASRLRLPIGPVISVSSVKWRNRAGQIATLGSGEYALQADALGSFVRFRSGFSMPGDLYETAAVTVEFVAGYANTNDDPPVSTVPAGIKTAIRLMAKKSWSMARTDLFKQSETVEGVGSTRWSGMVEVSGAVDAAVESLLSPFRVRRI